MGQGEVWKRLWKQADVPTEKQMSVQRRTDVLRGPKYLWFELVDRGAPAFTGSGTGVEQEEGVVRTEVITAVGV